MSEGKSTVIHPLDKAKFNQYKPENLHPLTVFLLAFTHTNFLGFDMSITSCNHFVNIF
jgi:hypothetical protein